MRFVAIALMSGFVSCTPGEPSATRWEDSVTAALRRGLDGIETREGRIFWLDVAGCEPIVDATGTCFSAHPGSPYGLLDFAGGPVDAPATEVPNDHLAQHEALLFVGHLPPVSRYWSFNLYQYRKARSDGDPVVTFGSVATSANLISLPADGAALAPGSVRSLAEAPFDRYVALIFTANRTTGSRVAGLLRPLLAEAGYGPEAVVVHPIAYRDEAGAAALVASGERRADEVYSLTMGPGGDTFAMALRVAGLDPEHPYLDAATVPAATFRVTLDAPGAADPFPWPELPPASETGEAQPPRFADARDAVVALLDTRFQAAGLETVTMPMRRRPRKTSADCVNRVESCGANNDDAQYHRAQGRFVVADGSGQTSVVAVGVNHSWLAEHQPGAPRVTYASLTLNNLSRGVGVATRFDHDLRGSLDAWFDDGLPASVPLADSEHDALYVVQFARSCGTDAPACVPFDDGPLGVGLQERLWFTERVYLNQTSGTAPAYDSVFAPRLIGRGPRVVPLEASGWLLTGP